MESRSTVYHLVHLLIKLFRVVLATISSLGSWFCRAAFVCGREPNFELSEEEKQELQKFKWEDFLAMTRHAITNKSSRRAFLSDSSIPFFSVFHSLHLIRLMSFRAQETQRRITNQAWIFVSRRHRVQA